MFPYLLVILIQIILEAGNRKRKSMSSVPDPKSKALTSAARKRKRMSLAVTEGKIFFK